MEDTVGGTRSPPWRARREIFRLLYADRLENLVSGMPCWVFKHRSTVLVITRMRIVNIDWGSTLDRLRARMSVNDSGLAEELGLSRSMLSQVRIGHRPLPFSAKLRLMNKLGYPLTVGTVLSCLSDEMKSDISTWCRKPSQELAHRRARHTCFMFLQEGFARLDIQQRARFFGQLCSIAGCDLLDLRSLLHLEEAEFLDVTAGNRDLHFLAKTAIYDCFDSAELALVVKSCIGSEY
jgi:transcriptional regulator with XRE-family HTH domain